jgi:copper chaperone CopZ
MAEKEYTVQGMKCVSCTMGIQKLLKRNPKIEKVDVTFGQSNITVTFKDPNDIDDQTVIETVARLGYKASPTQP